jgi:molybdopterin/thiamine biosynthesis adenylyltransferase/rhodanese-related sulfurtransferase
MGNDRFERYERQIVLNGFGLETQGKLTKASVLVVGAGGLGCPALQYLVAAGVGTIGIIDHDTISLSNLHRQILYSTDDIGKLKSLIAAKKLNALNGDIQINNYPVKLMKDNIIDLFSGYDIVLDCTDNFDSRYLINDVCVLLEKPFIFAAVSSYEGQLAVFNVPDKTGNSTNYRDLFPIPPERGEIANCEENGILGVLPGIIGTMQAAEAIKYIAGLDGTLSNTLLNYNLTTQEIYQIKISKAKKDSYKIPSLDYYKKSEKPQEAFKEIDGIELQKLVSQNDAVIVDVREYTELPKLYSDHYQQIPMSSINETSLNSITSKHVIFVCQHGIRSVRAAESLHDGSNTSMKLYSLKGGIVRWMTELRELHFLS